MFEKSGRVAQSLERVSKWAVEETRMDNLVSHSNFRGNGAYFLINHGLRASRLDGPSTPPSLCANCFVRGAFPFELVGRPSSRSKE